VARIGLHGNESGSRSISPQGGAGLYFGRAPPYVFSPRILDAESPRIGGPDASPGRKPITCHKRNQSRIASEILRMR
jgi:hypothetical protein